MEEWYNWSNSACSTEKESASFLDVPSCIDCSSGPLLIRKKPVTPLHQLEKVIPLWNLLKHATAYRMNLSIEIFDELQDTCCLAEVWHF